MINAPSNLTATAVSPYVISLSWQDNSNNEDGFELERSTSPAIGYSLLATIRANTTSYSDMVLPSLITYYYKVRGFNSIGDRGEWSNTASAITVRPEWQSIAVGEYHSLAINNDGSLWGWGDNTYGQLGLGDASPFTVTNPILLGSDTDWRIIVAGYNHTLAIKMTGTLWSWGSNDAGELGLGDIELRTTPSLVGTDSDLPEGQADWLVIAGGEYYSLAQKTDGTLWSWGANEYGQLGLGYTTISPTVINTPTQIYDDTDWFSVTTSGRHSIALKTNRTLWAWGWNYYSQLGDGTKTDILSPCQIGSDSDWFLVSAGYTQTIALKTTGTLWKWGNVGTAYGSGDLTPTQIGSDTDWAVIKAGGEDLYSYYGIALKTTGTLWSWGNNNYGQLGLGDSFGLRSSPIQIGTLSDWVAVATGRYHTIARTNDGTLWGWGQNNLYQLGIGNTVTQYTPMNLNLSRPTNLIALVISNTQINLSWTDNSSNETGFIIERSISPTAGYSIFATVNANTTSCPDETVTRENIYYYRVKAVYPGGDSDYSNVAVGFTVLWVNKINPLSARRFHSMVWDSIGQRVIMFGGDDGVRKNDLWWYDPASNTWTEKIVQDSAGSPSARIKHSMVWDAVGQRVIMFGGTGVSPFYKNDLWWYDPASNTWTEKIEQDAAGSPSARYTHSMVWDPIRQRVIMFGGSDGTNNKNDLWWYDPALNTWTEKIVQDYAGSPSARYAHSMVWDTVGQRVIMFGGYDGSNKNDLWWYNSLLNTWTEKIVQDAEGSPSARQSHSMDWDPIGGRAIMFGGYDNVHKNDLWWYDPTSGTNGAWIMRIDQGVGTSPSVRRWHSMVWDPTGGRAIMFGGESTGFSKRNDLWWYNPELNNWTEKIAQDASGSPSARYAHAMVWDPTGGRVIMFGGSDASGNKNDLWWYAPALNTWIQKIANGVGTSPSARQYHSMVWDNVGQRVIMFGGYDGSNNKNDLWWYEPVSNTWTQKIAQGIGGSPSARQKHSMVWDSIGQKVIMFGGGNLGAYKNDLWWYDPTSGTNGSWIMQIDQDIVTSPSARRSHSMVWDPVGQRMIMFGGDDVSGYFRNDLWWYAPALNTWTQKIIQGVDDSPSARYAYAMVWDPIGGRAIMFGGNDGSNNKNDLWWYDPESNKWTGPVIASGSPSARYFHSTVWDNIGQRLIMFGGSGGTYYKNDLWWWQ